MKLETLVIAGVIAASASAIAAVGTMASAADNPPAEVTVYGYEAATEDKVVPGPDPIEGVAEGFYFAGRGIVDGGREVVDGIGESGGIAADDVAVHGAPGIVSGTVKGAGRIGEGAVRGAGAIGGGAVKGAGCVVTFGAIC